MDKEREERPYYSQDLSYGSYKAKVAVYSDHALIRIDSTLGKDFSRLLSYLFAYYLDITGVSYTLEENLVTIRYPKLSENILAYIVKYLDAYTYSSFDTNSEAINPVPDNSEPQEPEINEEIEIASQKEVSSTENELIVASESEDMPLFVNNYTILNSEAKLTVYSDHALFWTDLSFSQGDVKNLANTFSALYPVLKNVKYTLTEDTVTLYYPEQSESFLRNAVSVAEKDVNYYLNAMLASETAKTGNQVAVTEARLPEVREVVKPIIEPAPISPVKPVETIATADKKETFSINKLSALTMLSINSEFISFKVGARYDFTEKIAARLNIYNGFDVQVLYDSKLISNETLSIYGGLGLGYSALRKWNAQLFVGVQKTFDHIAAAAEFGFINSKPQASLILSYQF